MLELRNLDFSCVRRTCKIKTCKVAEPERYVHALTSVPEAVTFTLPGLSQVSEQHGSIYTSRLIVEDICENRFLVRVIADMDFAVATQALGDREVRHHTNDMVRCIKTMFETNVVPL